MPTDLTLLEGPAAEPISLAVAKRFLRVDADLTEDDDYITSLLTATRLFIEKRTGRSIGVQTWREHRTVPASGVVRLHKAPVVEVLSVEVDGEETTCTPRPGNRLEVGSGREVVVEYRAGSEPDTLTKQAMQILIAHWFEQREPIITGTILAEVPNHYNAIESLMTWHGGMPSP
jgi:hypothetical protein